MFIYKVVSTGKKGSEIEEELNKAAASGFKVIHSTLDAGKFTHIMEKEIRESGISSKVMKEKEREEEKKSLKVKAE